MKRVISVIMVSLLLLSCSKKQEKNPSNVNNSEQSLFETTKEQTVKNPNDPEAWYSLADLYDRSEMYREEIDALKKVVALKPSGYAYLKMGNAYQSLGEYQDAIKSFNLAKRYFPKYPVLYNNLAVAYGKVGRLDDEIKELTAAISFRPQYATARYNLGTTYLKQGKIDLALKQYQELLKFDGGTAEVLKKEIDAKRK